MPALVHSLKLYKTKKSVCNNFLSLQVTNSFTSKQCRGTEPFEKEETSQNGNYRPVHVSEPCPEILREKIYALTEAAFFDVFFLVFGGSTDTPAFDFW